MYIQRNGAFWWKPKIPSGQLFRINVEILTLFRWASKYSYVFQSVFDNTRRKSVEMLTLFRRGLKYSYVFQLYALTSNNWLCLLDRHWVLLVILVWPCFTGLCDGPIFQTTYDWTGSCISERVCNDIIILLQYPWTLDWATYFDYFNFENHYNAKQQTTSSSWHSQFFDVEKLPDGSPRRKIEKDCFSCHLLKCTILLSNLKLLYSMWVLDRICTERSDFMSLSFF